MLENMRVGGEGRYFDARASSGHAQAIAARGHTHDFLAALRCEPGLSINDADVAQTLTEATAEEADLLRQACCFCRRGNRAEALVALDQFVESVAHRYGSELAARNA